jgi:hypothetical protein
MEDSLYSSLLKVTPLALPFLVGSICYFTYLFYQWLLPQPIPGIPYNKDAANRIFGDVPSALAHAVSTKQFFSWLPTNNVKLNSPIVQVWPRPFAKPWVLVTDFRESQDVLASRTKEFDRSDFFGNLYIPIMPDNHLSKKTPSKEFKRSRKLLQDLMAPQFLHQVRCNPRYIQMHNY